MKEVLDQRRVRIIAACFGNQIVGRALGARVRDERYGNRVDGEGPGNIWKDRFGESSTYFVKWVLSPSSLRLCHEGLAAKCD